MKKILILASILLLASCGTNVDNVENMDGNPIEEITIEEQANDTVEEKDYEQINQEDITNISEDIDIQDADIVALMKTSKGNILLDLETELAPITTSNFIGLAKKDYYDGIIFHRVIDGFMIQGGDPTGTGMGGDSIYGGEFDDEFTNELSNTTYTVAMANSGENTNTSQFFINTQDNTFLDFDKEPLRSKHAVFAKVIDGFDVVEAISKTEVIDASKPVEDIVIQDIGVYTYNSGEYNNYEFDEQKALDMYTDKLAKELEAKKSIVLKQGDTPGVHYTLTLSDGTKIDSSLDRGEVFYFTIGAGQVISGWDKGLVGHKIGDKFDLVVSPEDGYGELEQQVEKSLLQAYVDNGYTLEVGDVLPSNQGDIEIIAADETTVTVKNPSQLAGETLYFEIEVMDIK